MADEVVRPVDGDGPARLIWTYEPMSAAGGPAPPAVIYAMVTADGSKVKIGACEHGGNALRRRTAVERTLRSKFDDESLYPLELAVVSEIEGLALGDDRDEAWDERWKEVEHLESAMRLAVARRVGRLSRLVDYVEVERVPISWSETMDAAWIGVLRLASGST
ncbi:MAG: hypothetical protein AAGA17_20275 [Actinomycetota bacterium]